MARTTLFSFLIILLFSTTYLSQEIQDLKIGDAISLESKILKQTRTIFVYKPMGYQNSDQTYPVIYVLDALGNFIPTVGILQSLTRSGKMPKSIIVGITNIERTWDYTPVEEQGREGITGGGNTFLKFIKEELKPYIDTNYKTTNYNTLIGHSLCGMFSVYTLVKEPELFNSFIAISPYLMYADEYVLNQSEKIFEDISFNNKMIFITLGNEPDYVKSIDRLKDQLSDVEENISWEFLEFADENHVSVVHPSIYKGFEFIYSDWQMPASLLDEDVEKIISFYSNLSKKYGYKIIPPEATLNRAGYQFLGKQEFKSAIDFFRYACEQYPESANTYDSLGEALEKSGDLPGAVENYNKAIELGKIVNDPNLSIYNQNLKRVSSLLKKK